MASIRTDWQRKEVQSIFELPLNELLFQAQTVHRQHFSPNSVQLSSLLSIKTGACPEDCGYCSQSGHHNTGLEKEKLMSLEEVKVAAQAAKDNGATRFCMGAAWRSMPKSAEDHIVDMVTVVKDLGLESCMTLGMLESDQAAKLSKAGLDYYNHNLDTSPERYGEIVTTRTYEDRLNTLKNVREQGMKVCCGGILGLGETRDDRISLLMQLSNMEQQPESVPINQLIPVPGTPLENAERVDGIEFVRTCAVARILMPKSYVRLSAGRHEMTHELQALCFQAGVNSIFYGEKLLTEGNQVPDEDGDLFQKLGLQVETLTA